MAAICPNISSPEWKALVKSKGETEAYKLWMANGYDIPSNDSITEANPLTSLSKEEKNNLKESSQLMEGVSLQIQTMAVNNLFNRFVTDALEDRDTKSSEIFDDYTSRLISVKKNIPITKLRNTKLIEESEKEGDVSEAMKIKVKTARNTVVKLDKISKNIDALLTDSDKKNESKIFKAAEKKLLTLRDFKIVDKNGNSTKVDDNEDDEVNLENTKVWEDDFAFTVDNRKTMSSRIRMFLASIAKVKLNRDGSIKKDKNGNDVLDKDFLQNVKYIDFQAAYEQLHNILADKTSVDFDNYMNILEDYANNVGNFDFNTKWILNLVDMLKSDTTPANIRAEFVSNMTKNSLDMKVLTWKLGPLYNDKGKKRNFRGYTLSMESANINSLVVGTQLKWSDNLKRGSMMDYDQDADDFKFIITDEAYTKTLNDFTELKAAAKRSDKAIIPSLLIKYVDNFGIDMELAAAKDLVERKKIYLDDGTSFNLTNFINSNLRYLNDNLIRVKTQMNAGNDVFFKTNNLIGISAVKKLAEFNAKYTPHLFTNSFNFGSKPLYKFTNPKYAIDRKNRLLNNEDGLLDELATRLYSKNSYYGKVLRNKSSNLRKVFDIREVALVPLREVGRQTDKTLNEFGEPEYELLSIGQYFSIVSEKTYKDDIFEERNATFMTTTPSNKTTPLVNDATAFLLTYNKVGRLDDKFINFIIDNIITSEWERIHYMTGPEETKGSELFYNFPEMNDVEYEIQDADGTTSSKQSLNEIAMLTPTIEKNIRPILSNIIRNRIDDLTDKKLKFWAENNIGVNTKKVKYSFLPYKYLEMLGNRLLKSGVDVKTTGDMRRFMANEMVYNYIVNSANMFQLIIGDHAQYYDVKKTNKAIQKVEEATGKKLNKLEKNKIGYNFTMQNLGKRMAGEIAPGYKTSNQTWEDEFNGERRYIQMYSKDLIRDTRDDILKYYASLEGVNVEDYSKINTTDAQEYSTWREHLTGLLAIGEIDESDFKKVKDALNNNKELKGHLLKIAMKPLKPVLTTSKFAIRNGQKINRRVYIKSSSFPLLPQFTKGKELDKLRLHMEDIQETTGMPVRFAYESAVKVGLELAPYSLYNEDGTMNEPISYDLDGEVTDDIANSNISYEVLDRRDFKIQQDIPFDVNKPYINSGSQSDKLMFDGILDSENYFYDNKYISGKELKKIYLDSFRDVFALKLSNFENKFLNDDDTIDISKIQSMMVDELYRTGIPTQSEEDGLLTKDGEFITPLWLSPHSAKYSSMLNSLIYNNTIKRKRYGRSSVLGSDAGIKFVEGKDSKIIWTDSFNGEELLPMRPDPNDKTKMLPAQIVVRFEFIDTFAGKNGQKLFLNHYIKDGKIDLNKVPADILKGFGFRIPTESHSSMMTFEIVGFLEDNMGDLIIAPKELVAQMGSDFDVDKLFRYLYNINRAEDGTLSKIDNVNSTNKDIKMQALNNKILDIQMAVLTNSDDIVQSSIMTPVGYGKLPQYKELIEKIKDTSGLQETYISSEFNRRKYLSGAYGKRGVSSFASMNVFNAMIQYRGTYMYHNILTKNGPKEIRESMEFGDQYNDWNGDMSQDKSLSRKDSRLKSKIITAFLGASVDDETQQLLSVLNITDETFNIIGFLVQAGYDEDLIIPYINQPIIKRYLSKKILNKSVFNTDKLTDEEIYDEIIVDYSKGLSVETLKLANFKGINASEKLISLLEDNTTDDFNKYQASILAKYVKIESLAGKYKSKLLLGNVDSRGMGKSMEEAGLKDIKIVDAIESDIKNLDVAFDNSISGMAYNNYSKASPYLNQYTLSGQVGFTKIMSEYSEVLNKKIKELTLDDLKLIVSGTKAFVTSLNSSRRLELLRGDNSILKRLDKIKDTDFYKNSKFLSRIRFNVNEKTKGYDGIIFDSNLTDEFIDDEIYAEIINMMSSNIQIEDIDIGQLMFDIIDYALLDGARFSPQTFSKYIPMYMYDKRGINEYAKTYDLWLTSGQIIEQIIQHNPTLTYYAGNKMKNIGTIEKTTGFSLNTKEELKYTPLYIYKFSQTNGKPWLYKLALNGFYVRIDVLGNDRTLNEYSYPISTVARSVINRQRSTLSDGYMLPSGINSDYDSGTFNKFGDRSITNLVGDNDLIFNTKTESKGNIKDVITSDRISIYDALQSMNTPLSNSMLNVFGKYLSTRGIVLKELKSARGKTNASGDIELDLSTFNNSTVEHNELLINHEIIHSITSALLDNPSQFGDSAVTLSKVLDNKLESIILNLKDSELDRYMAMFRYLTYIKKGKAGIISKSKLLLNLHADGKIQNPKLNKFVSDFITQSSEEFGQPWPSEYRGEVKDYYSLYNQHELLAGMADEKTVKFLESVSPEGNLLDKIKASFIEFFKSLGFTSQSSLELINLIFDIGALRTDTDVETGISTTNSEDTNYGLSLNNLFIIEKSDDGTIKYINKEGDVLTDEQIFNMKYINEILNSSDNNSLFKINIDGDLFIVDIVGDIYDSYGNKMDNLSPFSDSRSIINKNKSTIEVLFNHFESNALHNDGDILNTEDDSYLVTLNNTGKNKTLLNYEYTSQKNGKIITVFDILSKYINAKSNNETLIFGGSSWFIYNHDLLGDMNGNLISEANENYNGMKASLDSIGDPANDSITEPLSIHDKIQLLKGNGFANKKTGKLTYIRHYNQALFNRMAKLRTKLPNGYVLKTQPAYKENDSHQYTQVTIKTINTSIETTQNESIDIVNDNPTIPNGLDFIKELNNYDADYLMELAELGLITINC